MDLVLLDLLQIALGSKKTLCRNLSDTEWQELFKACKIQTIVGVALEGIERLSLEGIKPPADVLMNWIGVAQVIEAQNLHHRKVLALTLKCLEKGGVSVAFMKGLVCGARYHRPERRQCGDIDFVVREDDFARTLSLLEEIGEVDHDLVHEHHGMACVDRVLLEPHYKVHNFQNPKVDRAMKDLFAEVFPERLTAVNIGEVEVPVFPPAFEGVLLVGHMVNHVYAEGLGLRQVVDFYYWLISNYLNEPAFANELWRGLRMMRMERAFRVFVLICEEYLGLSHDIVKLEYTDQEKGFSQRMIDDIMAVGNFGCGKRDLGDNSFLHSLRSYLWVVKRCVTLGWLCPAEAKWWPISKFRRYLWKMKEKVKGVIKGRFFDPFCSMA